MIPSFIIYFYKRNKEDLLTFRKADKTQNTVYYNKVYLIKVQAMGIASLLQTLNVNIYLGFCPKKKMTCYLFEFPGILLQGKGEQWGMVHSTSILLFGLVWFGFVFSVLHP